MLTIKQLKDLIKDQPDDVLVAFADDDGRVIIAKEVDYLSDEIDAGFMYVHPKKNGYLNSVDFDEDEESDPKYKSLADAIAAGYRRTICIG